MRIDRPRYLDKMIRSRGNGFIKIITGLRRCGKSYLLKFIFRDYLLEEGIPADHIIVIDLEDKRQAAFKDPDYLLDHVDHAMKDENSYYILIDEVQEVRDFVAVLSTLNLKPNADLFVTGSNSKFLSSDIATEFRGRGEEIPMRPLSFSEFLPAYNGAENDAWLDYLTFGGLPQILLQDGEDKKVTFLRKLYQTVYLKDIYDRHKIEYPEEFEELVRVMASSIGSPLNPNKLANTFKSLKHTKDLTNKTISTYMGYLDDAFMTEKSDRYDVKGKNYIASLSKYYFQDDLGMPSFPSDRTKKITSWKTSYTTNFAIVISSLMSGTSRSALKTRRANPYVFLWRWISLRIRGASAIISNPHGGCRMQIRSSRKLALCERLATRSRRSL